MEKILEFKGNGGKIRGILHVPGNETKYKKKNLFLIVPYGLNNRIGPQRIYVKLARHLCSQGYHVFRPDSYGCGDSEGDITEYANRHRDDVFWELVEKRIFIDDVGKAVEFIKGYLLPDNICIYGICGGAVRSIYSGVNNKDIETFILSSFPSSVDRGSAGIQKKMTKNKAAFTLRLYVTNFFSPSSWLRVLMFKSDYKSIFNSLKVIVVNKASKLMGGKKIKTLPDDINSKLVDNLKTVIKEGRNLMIVFGENDRYSEDYEEKIESPFLCNMIKGVNNYKKVIIKDSNHEFHLNIWQEEYFNEISKWLKEKVPLNC